MNKGIWVGLVAIAFVAGSITTGTMASAVQGGQGDNLIADAINNLAAVMETRAVQGPQGEQGEQGPQGEQGEQGPASTTTSYVAVEPSPTTIGPGARGVLQKACFGDNDQILNFGWFNAGDVDIRVSQVNYQPGATPEQVQVVFINEDTVSAQIRLSVVCLVP